MKGDGAPNLDKAAAKWILMRTLTAIVVVAERVGAEGRQNGSTLGGPPSALENAVPLAANGDG